MYSDVYIETMIVYAPPLFKVFNKCSDAVVFGRDNFFDNIKLQAKKDSCRKM